MNYKHVRCVFIGTVKVGGSSIKKSRHFFCSNPGTKEKNDTGIKEVKMKIFEYIQAIHGELGCR